MTAETKPSKDASRTAELRAMASLVTPHYMSRIDRRPGEVDYPYIAPSLRLVSEYAKLRNWRVLREAGFKSRKDAYEKALEKTAEDWAKTSMGTLRVQMIQEGIPQRPDLARRFSNAEYQVQQETDELEDRSTHVLTVLHGVSEAYRFYPPRRGERKPVDPPIGIAYNTMRLMQGD